jgi:hypothetical protein
MATGTPLFKTRTRGQSSRPRLTLQNSVAAGFGTHMWSAAAAGQFGGAGGSGGLKAKKEPPAAPEPSKRIQNCDIRGDR